MKVSHTENASSMDIFLRAGISSTGWIPQELFSLYVLH